MGCNCKRALQIQEKYGTEVNENTFQKVYRVLLKIIILLIGLVFGVILVPVVVFILIFNQVFRDGKGITIPKKLSKYIR